MSNDRNERSGADWRTTGQAPFDEREGPMTTPRPQQDSTRKAGDKPPDKTGADKTGADKAGECDDTHFAQASGAGRGGTTPFGGVERVKPRSQK